MKRQKSMLVRPVALMMVLSLLLSLGLAGCGSNAGNAATPTATPTPAPTPTPTPVPMVPAQEGLPAHVEYRFLGEWDTGSIGIAAVTGDLFYDGTYEVVAAIGPYNKSVTWGDWGYQEGTFVFTDLENDLHLLTTADGNTYTFTVPFMGAAVDMTAVMTGEKPLSELNVDPTPEDQPTGSGDSAAADPAGFLFDIPAADGFITKFYSDGTLKNSTTMSQSLRSEGTWTYSEADGLSLVVDGEPVDVTLADGVYSFVIKTGQMFPRRYDIPAANLAQAVGRHGIGEVSEDSYPKLADRYAETSDEVWKSYFLESGVATEKNIQLVSLPKTALTKGFRDDLTPDIFVPQPGPTLVDGDPMNQETSRQGRVYRLTYETYVYDYYYSNNVPEDQWQAVEKECYVYLPAGYDASKQYNVYYHMHGAGGDASNLFSACIEGRADNGAGDLVLMLDTLIANGTIEPLIFVACTTNTDTSGLDKAIQRVYSGTQEAASFPYELEKDIIPAVESNFSSYAGGDVSHDSLVASRHHRAFTGFSAGSYVVWNTIAETMDVMANFAPSANGCSNGGMEDNKAAIEELYDSWCADENAGYDLFLVAQCGQEDHTWDASISTFDRLYELAAGGEKLVYGKNFVLDSPKNGAHNTHGMLLGIYNSLTLFFQ